MKNTALKAWRARLGLSQTEAAKALGLSIRGYQNYESGERAIPHPVALACKYLEEHGA
jgi:transcriptional regulator with XRE-family HTH domain